MKQYKERLKAEIEAQGKSWREVSLAAGLSPGYLFTVFTEGKTPSIEVVVRICDVLGVPVSYIVEGYRRDPKTEEILRLWGQMSPEDRQAFERILKAAQGPEKA